MDRAGMGRIAPLDTTLPGHGSHSCFSVVVVMPPSLVVLLFGELGYIHFLFPNLFDFTFTPICRVFPEAPLLIRWISPSLLMDLVIFVNL